MSGRNENAREMDVVSCQCKDNISRMVDNGTGTKRPANVIEVDEPRYAPIAKVSTQLPKKPYLVSRPPVRATAPPGDCLLLKRWVPPGAELIYGHQPKLARLVLLYDWIE